MVGLVVQEINMKKLTKLTFAKAAYHLLSVMSKGNYQYTVDNLVVNFEDGLSDYILPYLVAKGYSLEAFNEFADNEFRTTIEEIAEAIIKLHLKSGNTETLLA
jgi:hypothetical protein